MSTSRSIDELSVSELVNEIRRLSHIYYNTDRSQFPDLKYDALKVRLRHLDPTNQELTRVGAPADRSNHLNKVKHTSHMGSIANAMGKDELRAWWGRVNPPAVVTTFKVDGLSILLHFNKGELVSVATRGDGKQGDDITYNARFAQGMVHQTPQVVIDGKSYDFTGTVRAELVLTTAAWQQLDPTELQVPRNLASGLARRKTEGEDCQYLTVVAHRIDWPDVDITRWQEVFSILQYLGFKVPEPLVFPNLEAVDAYFSTIQSMRSELEYEIDGLVVTTDDYLQFKNLGIDGENCPRGQIAYKFPAQTAESVLKGVEVNVGHTGALNPRAILEPVVVGGVTIRHATLSNFNEIRRLNLKIGDRVEVSRQGDVIPKILKVTTPHPSGGEIPEPSTCPVCGSPTARESVGDEGKDLSANIYCQNAECPAQNLGKIKRWIDSLGIKELGPQLRLALMDDFVFNWNGESRLFSTPADLYRLTVDELASLPFPARESSDQVPNKAYGATRAAKVIAQLDKSRSLTVSELVGSLGVKYLGKGRARNIQELDVQLGSNALSEDVHAWFSEGERLLPHARELGIENMAADIQQGLDSKRPLIEDLLTLVQVRPDKAMSVVTDGKLSGQSFCFTQCRMTDEEEARLQQLGGEEKGDVSGGLTYLVTKNLDKKTAKMTKAEKLGTKVISYQDFQKLIS